MSIVIVAEAIQTKRLVQFHYTGDTTPGLRIVEPHMLAYNRKNHFALSAWLQAGVSASGGAGWREFIFASMSGVLILEETFSGTRPGYRADGGMNFHTIHCCL